MQDEKNLHEIDVLLIYEQSPHLHDMEPPHLEIAHQAATSSSGHCGSWCLGELIEALHSRSGCFFEIAVVVTEIIRVESRFVASVRVEDTVPGESWP